MNIKKYYDQFLENIGKKFNEYFINISAINNFDYGDEYEVALCKALASILPERYGVCRGFIVTMCGNYAGDDIIIP